MIRTDTETHCLNCGVELHGRFCHTCGQKVAATQLAFKDVVHEATEEFLHLDSKTINTVKTLLTKPGLLTKDIVEGRRARYVTPLRLYIAFSFLYFFLLAFVPGAREQSITVRFTNDEGVTRRVTSGPAYERFVEGFLQIAPNVGMILTMPGLAVLTYAFFRKRQAYFVAHLYYSLHLHSVVFFGLSISTLFAALGRLGRIPGGIVAAAILPYYFIATRRFFGEPWTRTVVKGTLIALIYLGVLLSSIVVVVMFLMRVIKITPD